MEKHMAITFIRRSTLPVATKGKAATEPKITISDKGQLTLNPVAATYLNANGNGKVVLGFDSATGTVYLLRPDHKSAAKVDEKDFIYFKAPKTKEGKKSKGNILTLSFGTALQAGLGVDHVYDYKNSGSQTFAMKLGDDKNPLISFVLPKGVLPKRPVVKRQRKPKPAPPVAASATQQVNGAPVTTPPVPASNAEPELVIE